MVSFLVISKGIDPMKRKLKDGRPIGARDKIPRSRAAFSRTALKRAIMSAQAANLPISDLIVGNDGSARLIIGTTNKPDDTTNSKNPWDEVQPMRRAKSGLPKYCSWNVDRHGKRRVRFRKSGFTTYLTGTPWSEDFMRQYATALDGVKAQAGNIGAGRTVAGSVGALVAAYLDPLAKSSPFKNGAAETQRTRRNILENFRAAYGHLPLFRTDASGRRTMLLTREHVQRIVNEKSATPFAQRNFLNTLRAMFKWARPRAARQMIRHSASPA